jgi:hypothetical protein
MELVSYSFLCGRPTANIIEEGVLQVVSGSERTAHLHLRAKNAHKYVKLDRTCVTLAIRSRYPLQDHDLVAGKTGGR